MDNRPRLTRRAALTALAGAAGGALAAGRAGAAEAAPPLKGRLRQAVCRWCYGGLALEDLARAAAEMGLRGIDLLSVDELPAIAPFGLVCPMVNGPGGIPVGWNRVEQHERLIARSEELLPKIAEAGMPNMIVFSGNRRGQDDAEGLRNCAAGLRQIMPLAERLGVTVCMELLNSKRDHRDYQCDRTPWGADLVAAVGSERFRLLYDIYHMQIMEGDVIQTIRDHHGAIAHYHTGGVPGRAEIDESQELNYRRICEAIVETGFTGFLAQEFIPKGPDPLASLAAAARICDV